MTIKINEKEFENSIESYLLKNNYIKRNPIVDFNKEYLIDAELFFQFIQETQNNSWLKLQEIYGEDTKEKILQAYQKEVESESLIHVIRNGIPVSDVKLDCHYPKPESNMNPDAEIIYDKNILSIMRQVVTSKGNKPDLVLFLNGIPVATAEIKNPATGQSFEDAIKQYKEDRDPIDKLFSFKQGTLVHFAVDPYEVYMTTKLQKDETQFLPFNKGRNQGRGNPDNPDGYRTAYLWEEIWQKDTWIDIISDFISLQIIPQKYPLPDKENLIFPRYHQLDAVLKLVKTTKQLGIGENYLVQHSTGSGKSNTIAWLAYKLLRLFDKQNNPLFDGVLILTDRVAIRNQLGDAVEQFDQTEGMADVMRKSKHLAKNLKNYRKILTITQQQFPFVLDYISKVGGERYALIIDEAHSSQTPESRQKIQEVLTTNLEEAEKEETEIESQATEIIDQIKKVRDVRGKIDTLSYYAFTATPKDNTLKLFGTPVSGQDNIPFHTYSMKQAIDEGFILDVLKHYTTYESQFHLVKTALEDKVVEADKASRAILNYVDLHQLTLSAKSKIIVDHFQEHTKTKIGGFAKAMIVCSSRQQARKYKIEIDAYIKEKGYKEIKTLVAFSGMLPDEEGNQHTEQSINGTKTDKELREKFDTPEYNILIVAEKYQTGFDQPLLHTMYVDKRLKGIRAVQTLSRINRTTPGKTDTFVVDFKNSTDKIIKEFKPYFKQTSLIDKTDPHFIPNLYSMIMELGILIQEDLDKFAEIFFKLQSEQTDTEQGRLYSTINPILTRFDSAEEKIQDDFRIKIKKYIEGYSFISQIIRYGDTNLEKMYAVLKFIINQKPIKNVGTQLPDLRGDVSLRWYRLEKTHEGKILGGEEGGNLTRHVSYGTPKPPKVSTSLSEVIRAINEIFGGFVDEDQISLKGWFDEAKSNLLLCEIAKQNSFEDFSTQFEKKFLEIIISSNDANQMLVKRIYTEPDFKKQLIFDVSNAYWISKLNKYRGKTK